MGTEPNQDLPAPVDTGKYRRDNALEKSSDKSVSERDARLTDLADVAREVL